jgi:hypothetical protein
VGDTEHAAKLENLCRCVLRNSIGKPTKGRFHVQITERLDCNRRLIREGQGQRFTAKGLLIYVNPKEQPMDSQRYDGLGPKYFAWNRNRYIEIVVAGNDPVPNLRQNFIAEQNTVFALDQI